MTTLWCRLHHDLKLCCDRMIVKFPESVVIGLAPIWSGHYLPIARTYVAGGYVPAPHKFVQFTSVLHSIFANPNRQTPMGTICFIAIR